MLYLPSKQTSPTFPCTREKLLISPSQGKMLAAVLGGRGGLDSGGWVAAVLGKSACLAAQTVDYVPLIRRRARQREAMNCTALFVQPKDQPLLT